MHGIIRSSDHPIAESELILRSDGSLYHLNILPEHVSDKIITVGDPERVAAVSSMFDSIEVQRQDREFITHTGTYKGKRITVVSSGIGVDNMDIMINELDAAVNIDLSTRKAKKERRVLEIIRIGTSGSMHPEIPVGAFVASAFAFALDGIPLSYGAEMSVQENALNKALCEKFHWLNEHTGMYTVRASEDLLNRIAGDMFQGITATANGFYGPQGRSLRLQSVMEKRIDMYAGFQHSNYQITNFEMECSGLYALASMLGHKALTVCAIMANRATKEFHKQPSASIESLIRTVLERF